MIVHAAPTSDDHGVRPTPAPETPRRLPLYLYGRVSTHVGLDGPALLVRRADKAPGRYPLSRIARIIAGQRVEWSADALAACLRHGLPIVFLDRAGEPAGYLHATQSRPSRLDDILNELLDRPDGTQQYTLWLRAERMRILHAWRASRSAQGQAVADEAYKELVRQHVYREEAGTLGMAGAELYRSAVIAYALHHVQRAGAHAIYWGQHGVPLRLAEDLADLMALSLSLEMRGLGSAAHGDDAALLAVLHSFGAQLSERGSQILGRLHRRMKELLEQWR